MGMAEFMYAYGKLYPSKQEDVKLVDMKQGLKHFVWSREFILCVDPILTLSRL